MFLSPTAEDLRQFGLFLLFLSRLVLLGRFKLVFFIRSAYFNQRAGDPCCSSVAVPSVPFAKIQWGYMVSNVQRVSYEIF